MAPSILQKLADGEAALDRGDIGACEATCRTVLQTKADHPKALLLLGRCLGQSGRVQEALAPLQAAAQQMPKNPDVHYSLGMAFTALGMGTEAEKAYHEVLRLSPRHAHAYANLGVLLRDGGKLALAVACFREAVAIDPTLWSALENLANALFESQRFEEALAAVNQLLEAAGHTADKVPDSPPPALVMLQARILGKLERHHEAVQSLKPLTERQPVPPEVLYSLGQAQFAASQTQAAADTFLNGARGPARPAFFESSAANALMQLGRLDEALAASQRAVQLDPTMGQAWLVMAMIKSFKADDSDLAAMKRARQQPQLSRQSALELDFALGRALESSGDHDQAFAHFLAGNRAKRQQLGSEMDAVLATHEAIRDHYEQAQALSLVGAPSKEGPAPLFIVGLPRSGTTLIEQVLGSHPDVATAGELRALNDATLEVMEDYPAGLTRMTGEQLTRLAQAYRARCPVLDHSARFLTDKMPVNFEKVGLMAQAFPEAPIIHLRRSPLDSCLSCFVTHFSDGQRFSYDLEELGRYYRLYHDLMNMWRSVLPPGRMFELDYESVVADPEPQIRSLLDHCGLTWSDDCLAFYKTKRSVQTASAAQVRKPLYRSSIGRWRRFEKHLGPLITALGPLAEGDN